MAATLEPPQRGVNRHFPEKHVVGAKKCDILLRRLLRRRMKRKNQSLLGHFSAVITICEVNGGARRFCVGLQSVCSPPAKRLARKRGFGHRGMR
ncbi:hypothetical protein [Rhodalgimonas zhirmunskyi]|uniref:hypothetical protein n=1 Tax=Rhodalgimonas zhirmunskyi TaxID=2964767 RepID=UPI00295293B4|nr:hypothetical protein [Rhodoalgimonas zhirmunskyi]